MRKRFESAFTTLPIQAVNAKSEFIDAFQHAKRSSKGKGKGKDTHYLPLQMELLKEDDEDLGQFYDFFASKVKITSFSWARLYEGEFGY
jgi:hypothetical protein